MEAVLYLSETQQAATILQSIRSELTAAVRTALVQQAYEIDALYEWMRDGNSPYENGDGVCDDNCHPMDFIGTMRFWDDLRQEWLKDPEGFMSEHCPDTTSSEELNPEGWIELSIDE